MAGIEEAFEKFVKKISDIEGKDTEDDSNIGFGKNVYAPQDGLFFSPVQKNQIPFGDILKSDQRLNPPIPTPTQRNLSSEERMRLEDNEYFMSQGQSQYVSPVVQGQGFNKRDLKDFTKQYLQSQTPLGGGIGYQGPEYGLVAIKPFVGPDRSALLQGYYNTDNEGSRIQAGLSPKEQRIDYTGNTGTTFSAGRNTYQGNPYYTFNVNKPFAEGGVASMFRKRPGYAEGGVSAQDQETIENINKRLDYLKSLDPNYLVPGSAGGMVLEDAIAAQQETLNDILNKYNNQPTNFPTIDPFSGRPYGIDPNAPVQPVGPAPPDNYYDEVPTIDPFSGQQVSAQDQAVFSSEPEREIRRYEDLEYNPNTGNFEKVIREGPYWDTKEYSDPIIKIFDKEKGFIDIDKGVKGADHLLVERTINGTSINEYLNNIPTIDPFSGQQVSAQDQTTFTQPQAEIFPQQNIFQPPSPVDQFIGERRFQAEADAAARSGIPFTKTIQDYLGNLYSGPEIANMQEQTFGTSNLSGDTGIVSDLRHATAASQVRDKIANAVSMNYFNPAGILPQSLGLFGSQVLGAANEIQSIRPNMQSMRDIGEDLRANFYGATQVPYGQSATTTYNQLLNNPSLPSAQMRSQQEASARVMPTRMAYGGRVSMSDGGLTTTIAPAKGPDSQGVESLFRRRYN